MWGIVERLIAIEVLSISPFGDWCYLTTRRPLQHPAHNITHHTGTSSVPIIVSAHPKMLTTEFTEWQLQRVRLGKAELHPWAWNWNISQRSWKCKPPEVQEMFLGVSLQMGGIVWIQAFGSYTCARYIYKSSRVGYEYKSVPSITVLIVPDLPFLTLSRYHTCCLELNARLWKTNWHSLRRRWPVVPSTTTAIIIIWPCWSSMNIWTSRPCTAIISTRHSQKRTGPPLRAWFLSRFLPRFLPF